MIPKDVYLVYNKKSNWLEMNDQESTLILTLLESPKIRWDGIVNDYFNFTTDKKIAFERIEEILFFYFNLAYPDLPVFSKDQVEVLFTIVEKCSKIHSKSFHKKRSREKFILRIKDISEKEDDFKSAFHKVLALKYKTKTERIKESIKFIFDVKPSLNKNITSISTLLFSEFGNELELNIHSLRKALNKVDLDEIEASKAIKEILAPVFK